MPNSGRLQGAEAWQPLFGVTCKFTYQISFRSKADDETKEGMTVLYANLCVCAEFWQIAGRAGLQPVCVQIRSDVKIGGFGKAKEWQPILASSRVFT